MNIDTFTTTFATYRQHLRADSKLVTLDLSAAGVGLPTWLWLRFRDTDSPPIGLSVDRSQLVDA